MTDIRQLENRVITQHQGTGVTGRGLDVNDVLTMIEIEKLTEARTFSAHLHPRDSD
jgi:hypothetical protein